jgi:hypothetical protein
MSNAPAITLMPAPLYWPIHAQRGPGAMAPAERSATTGLLPSAFISTATQRPSATGPGELLFAGSGHGDDPERLLTRRCGGRPTGELLLRGAIVGAEADHPRPRPPGGRTSVSWRR